MALKIRSASNRASSVMMPGSGAGENETLPRTKLPAMMVFNVNTFVVGFMFIILKSFVDT